MDSNYIPAWTVALNLGYCDEYNDLKTRQKCLWFVISKGPDDILSKALDQIHLIEIQMLHKDLELWIPPNESVKPNDADDVDSEEEFIDAVTTVRNIRVKV